MNSVLKKTLLASLVAPFALAAQSGNATQITQWDYKVDSSFSSPSYTTTGGGTQTATDNMISWGGTGNERSSVSIEDIDSSTDMPARLKLVTDGGTVDGGTFTHNNQTIGSEFSALTGFKLTSSLTLDPFQPSGVGSTQALPDLTFNTFFTETPNDPGTGGTCADGNAEPCGDIFTLGNVNSVGSMVGGSFQITPQTFVMEDYKYTVFLELADLMLLSSDACAAAGYGNQSCVGLLTPENSTNTFQTKFSITSTQLVPEPGTLALLGLGLAGLGFSRRRKAAKA